MSHLLHLPGELQDEIITYLEFPHSIKLKMTCRHFNNLIPKLSHEQLLEAEQTICSGHIACRFCLRLRPAFFFADMMHSKKRRVGGIEANKRFCLDCGLLHGAGITRYNRGARLSILTEPFVICIQCNPEADKYRTYDQAKAETPPRKFLLSPAPREDPTATTCKACWEKAETARVARDRRAKTAQEKRERAERKARRADKWAEHVARRRELSLPQSDDEETFRDDLWHDLSDSDDDYYHMVQMSCFGDCASDFW